MLDFCLIVHAAGSEPVLHDLSGLTPLPTERAVSYRVGGNPAISVQGFWAASHPFTSFAERVRIDGAGFRLLVGYPLQDGKPVRTVDAFDAGQAAGYRGDYFYLRIGGDGQVTIAKSPVCSYQLYHAEADGRQVLASRAGLAAVAASNTLWPEPDAEFARWACTYGIGGNDRAIHQGVRVVLQNQTVNFAAGRIEVSAQDFAFLRDEDLAELHARDPDSYWDMALERLSANAGVIDLSDQAIEFPLSGGKDSRLLLGLLLRSGRADRIARVFTNGPATSPEVRAARMVCDHLGLAHETVDTTAAVSARRIEIDDKLPRHAHLTEAEMSPDSLSWARSRRNIVELHGQEGGLRNITHRDNLTDRDALVAWFDIHLGQGDRCGMFRKGVAERTRDEIRTYVDAALACGIAAEDVPSLHRVTYRMGRWVGRTWRFYNDRHFAPYLFVDTDLIRFTFNSGAASRLREDFHYQMLRRIDPKLAMIPFSGQTWPEALARAEQFAPPEPLVWTDAGQARRAHSTHDALVRAFPAVQAFFQGHSGAATDAILDRRKFAGLDVTKMHPGTYQSLWQLIQIALFESVPDLTALSDGASATDYGLPSFDY